MIECVGLMDGDLPGQLETFSGHFDRIVLHDNNFTFLDTNSFPSNIYVDNLIIADNTELIEIKGDFMSEVSQYQSVKQLGVNGNSKLR